MKLIRLILQGFKSFADRTTIDFAEGMTVIVGPNGCGKSNISDAVRWVLGEQNVRNIRGQKAEDIIFSGSEKRKAKFWIIPDMNCLWIRQKFLLPAKYSEMGTVNSILTRGPAG